MKSLALTACILILLGSNAFGQSYAMTVHLSNGDTVTIPADDIRRIEFSNIMTGAQDPGEAGPLPGAFRLLQNFPNPFNPSTTIAFVIPDAGEIAVRIFDLKGALVKELLHGAQEAGRHQVTWDGTDGAGTRVSSGVYVYSVVSGGRTLSQRLILVK